MALDYVALAGVENVKADLQARVQQFAREAYQHSLNLDTAKTAGNDELVSASTEALSQLDAAIESSQAELAKLDA